MSTLRHSRLRIAYAALLGVALALGLLATMPILAQSSNADPVKGYANRAPTFLQMANQAGPGQFVVDLAYDAIWGYVAPGDTITVAQGSGNYGAAQADALGFFWTPLWQSSGRPADITSTDTLQIHVNGSLSATITVSSVNGLVDVLNDRVVGTISGAASTPVTVSLGVDPGVPSVNTTTDASGRFTATFTAVDISPEQNAVLEYRSGPHTIRAFLFPSRVFAVYTDWNEVIGYAQPGQVVTTTVYTGTGSLVKATATGQADRSRGYYDLILSSGAVISPGDVIEVNLGGGAIISTTAATLTLHTDVAANRVTGIAPAGAIVRADLWRLTDDKLLYYQVKTTADASGVYTADFGGVTNLQVFDWIQVAVADSSGNETALSSGAPMITINESSNSGWARVDGPNLTVTATLDTGSNIYIKTGVSGPSNYYSFGRFPGGPDIQPGHRVTVETVSWTGVMTVANLSASLDTTSNRLLGDTPTGRVQANVSHAWSDRNPAGLGVIAWQLTATSPFTLAYTNFDVRDGDSIWLAHFDSNGFRTVRSVNSRYFQADMPYGVGAPQFSTSDLLTATLYASDGVTIKRQTSQDDDPNDTWYWMEMQGEIATGDWVTVTDGLGWTAGVRIPNLTASVSDITDTVWGQGPKSLLLIQHNWDWETARFVPCDDYKLDFGYFGQDVLPGDRAQVMYFALNGDRVVAERQAPAPHLRINKQPQGTPGVGGNMTFRIQYWNDGELAAENTLITDTLEGMSYLSDLSSFSHTGSGSGPIIWSLGTLPAQSYGQFDVFVHVTSPASSTVTNTAQIATSNPYDRGGPGEKERTWSGQVQVNDTHLGVDKWAWTGDPLPGYDTVFAVNVCNNGSTGSSQVTLTDTTHPSMTLKYWWGQTPGWTQVVSSSHQLVISRPSLSGGQCEEVYVRAQLSASAWPDMPISNTAVITASNDLEDNDNEITWEGSVGSPHTNLNISKNWNWGQLVPGGQLRYNINYNNNGNVPVVATIHITDTLPVSTTFRESLEFGGGPQVVPVFTGTDYVVWEVNGLDNGYSGGFEVVLDVDDNAPPGIVLTNTVEIRPQPDEDSYTDNTSIVTETLHAPGPNLRVTMAREWRMDGGRLRYDIQFENVGSEIVYNVWLTDVLPSDTGIAWQNMQFDPNRIISSTQTGTRLCWEFSELNPGDSGWLSFAVNLDDPDARPRWYTNTVEITTPPSDTNPTDNTSIDVAIKGEVDRAEIWMNTIGSSNMWGQAVPGTVTITTAYTQVTVLADPACGGCWPNGGPNPDVGPVQPGDTLTVTAGASLLPVVIHVPNPFADQADSSADQVWGQIGGWTNQVVEIHGDWPSGYKEVTTDASGYYTATYADVPRGAQGYVRFITRVTYANVIFHHPFQAPDLILRVHTSDDWIGGNYEAGHTIWLTVTNGSGTITTTAAISTTPNGGWGWAGFQTDSPDPTNWIPSRPDITPGDWVYGSVDNGNSATVHVGTVNGSVSAATDSISGTILANWFTQTLPIECHPWGGPPNTPSKSSTAAPDGSTTYSCAWNPATEWDVQPGQYIAVWYIGQDANWVGHAFREPAPDLRVEKWREGNGEVASGSTVVYSIRYQNQGEAAGQAFLTDTLPMNTAYVADSSGFPAHISGNVITWSLGSVLPYTLPQQFQLVLTNSASVSDTLNNQADIGVLYDTNSGNNHAEAQVHVGSGQPDLYVNKNANPGDPAPGQLFRYTIDYGNQNQIASSPVWLTDTLPLSTTLVSWQSENNYNLWTAVVTTGGQLALYAPALPGNYGDRILVTLRLDSNASYGTQLFNTVVITTSGDSNPDNNSQVNDQAWVSPPRYDVAVNKDWAYGALVPDGEINYDIRYNNNGNSIAPNVMLTDTLPSGTALVTSVVDLGWGITIPFPPSSIVGNQLVWSLGNLPVNTNQALRLTLRVDSAVSPGTTLTNCASITASSFEDHPYDNTSCRAETVRATGPNLRVTKFADWQGTGGLQYRVRIENIGTTTEYNVLVTDTFPVSMTLNGWNLNYWEQWWVESQSGNQLTVRLSQLMPGWTAWLNAWMGVPSVPNGTLFTNTVEMTTPPGDVNSTDNSAQLVVGMGPDLSIDKWLTGGTPKPGQLLTYTLHVQNHSQAWWTAGNVWVTDTLPTGLEFISALQRKCGGGVYYCQHDPDHADSTSVAWNYGRWGNGWVDDLIVTVRVTSTAQGGDVLTNTATVASDDPVNDIEPYYSDNAATRAVTVLNPRFQLSKGYASSLVAGMPLTYTITVTNVGNEAATGVVVTDTLPSAVGGGVATWSGLTIPTGNATQVMTSVILPCTVGTMFTNQSYRVSASTQDVKSDWGPPLALTTISPTITASFVVAPNATSPNQTVSFTATTTTNGRPIMSYTWNFGDGNTGSGLATTHAYTRPNVYTVTLTASDSCGLSASKTIINAVTVANYKSYLPVVMRQP